MQLFNVEQGTPEWLACRAGIVTASSMKDALAKGEGKTRKSYIYKLIGERMTGEPAEQYSNKHMERGHELEPKARELYQELSGAAVERVGFVRNFEEFGGVGYSPDGFADEGLLEIKTRLPHLQAELLDRDEIPTEHRLQIQCGLWVTGRPWLDFVSYWPGMPLFVKRAYPDFEAFEEMGRGVKSFYAELAETMRRINTRAAA